MPSAVGMVQASNVNVSKNQIQKRWSSPSTSISFSNSIYPIELMNKNKERAYYVFIFVVNFSVLLLFSEWITLREIFLLFFVSILIHTLAIYHAKKRQKLRALHRAKNKKKTQ